MSKAVLTLFAILSVISLFNTAPSKEEESFVITRVSSSYTGSSSIRHNSVGGGVFRTGGGFNYGK